MSKLLPKKKKTISEEQTMKSKNMAPDVPNTNKEIYRSIMEGRAILRITSEKVFYNPVQEFNRDLSIVALTVFIEDFKKQKLLEAEKLRESPSLNIDNEMEQDKPVDITILEALSATGLRSIRYAKELVDVTKIVANDLSLQAVETIRDNISFNNVDHIVVTSHEDAAVLMLKHKQKLERFTIVDLDPYGSPSIFLDGAVQCVAEGGMLLVTATDMAVLAGNSPETCYAKYGAISLKTKCCHEMALRILLQSIESHANRYCRYIVPMLSISADFYIRVFVKVFSGAGMCKNTPSKLSMVYHCVGCHTMTLQPLSGFKKNATKCNPDQVKTSLPKAPPVGSTCEHCNESHQMGGPIWSGPLHEPSFVKRALAVAVGVESGSVPLSTARRMYGVLSVISEELPVPLYHTLDRLCATVHTEMIPIMQFRSALLHAGYQVSFSHANKLSIKTNAPNRFIWDIMRKWTSLQPAKAANKLEAHPVARHILSQPCSYEIVLTERQDANPDSRREKRTRFQFNPAPNWGPGCRSTVNTEDNKNAKAKRNQNKRKSKWYKIVKKRCTLQADDKSKESKQEKKLIIGTATSDADTDVATDTVKDITAVEATADADITTKPTNGDYNDNVEPTEAKVVEAPQPVITDGLAEAKE